MRFHLIFNWLWERNPFENQCPSSLQMPLSLLAFLSYFNWLIAMLLRWMFSTHCKMYSRTNFRWKEELKIRQICTWNVRKSRKCDLNFSFLLPKIALILTCCISCFSIFPHNCCNSIKPRSLFLNSMILFWSSFSKAWQFLHPPCKISNYHYQNILETLAGDIFQKCNPRRY